MTRSNTGDIVVIGGGVIGLSCAWRLAREGAKVVLLERDVCGAGATGASLGVLWPPSPLRRGGLFDLHRASLNAYPAFAAEIAEASGAGIKYETGPALKVFHAATQRERGEREARAARAAGEQTIELVDDRTIRELEPAVTPAGLGGMVSRGAAKVSVDALLGGLVSACRAAGVRIEERAKADALKMDGHKVTAVECAGRLFPCAAVVAAAGAWNNSLGPEFERRAGIEPVRGEALLLHVKTPLRSSLFVRGWKVYLVPDGAGRLMLGATAVKAPGFSAAATLSGLKRLMSGAESLLPSIGSAEVTRAWAGLRPSSSALRPYISAMPGMDGVFVAAGHYKTGIALAPATATAICSLILGRPCPFDLKSVEVP